MKTEAEIEQQKDRYGALIDECEAEGDDPEEYWACYKILHWVLGTGDVLP